MTKEVLTLDPLTTQKVPKKTLKAIHFPEQVRWKTDPVSCRRLGSKSSDRL